LRSILSSVRAAANREASAWANYCAIIAIV